MVGSMAVQADPATRERSAATPGHGEERVADRPLPLENGDRLSRAEFERRYTARPDLKKAELIEGVVYMPSPVRAAGHAEPHAAIDLPDKLRAYRRNGVQEYLVWRVLERQIDWFVLSDGEYRPLAATAGGMLESRVFPGLRLAVDALLHGDIAGVLAELRNGLSIPAHAEFVEHLRAAEATAEEDS